MKTVFNKLWYVLMILSLVVSTLSFSVAPVFAVETDTVSVKLTPTDDVTISAGAASGDNTTLTVRRQTTIAYTNLTLMKFSLGSLKNAASISSAKLGLYVISSKNGSALSNNILRIHKHSDDTWTESTPGMALTADNTSTIPIKSSSDTFPSAEEIQNVNIEAADVERYYEFDITDYVNELVLSGAANCNLVVNSQVRPVMTTFNSSEHADVNTRPYLIIEYEALPEGSYIIPSSENVAINEEIPDTNMCSTENDGAIITQCHNGWNRRSLVKFPTKNIDYVGKYVKKATLKMYATINYVRDQSDNTITVSPKFNIMPADSNWTETTVTWNTAPAISNDIIATNTIPGGQTAVNRYIEFDVTAYMNSFMDATAGEDVTFAGQPVSYSGAKGSVYFASSRSSVGMPPVLEVELADKVFDTDASSFDKNTKQITATYTGTETDFIIVAVLYGSGNNLKNIAFSEENSNTLVYNIPDGVQDGDYVKFLLLSDMTDIKPLERPVSVNFIAE